MAEITFVSIELDDLDLDEETRALLERAIPAEPIDFAAVLTPEKIDEALIVAGLVELH